MDIQTYIHSVGRHARAASREMAKAETARKNQALETAAALELPLPLMNTVNQLQEMARAQGLTRLNTPAAIGKLYERLTATDLSQATLAAERIFPQPKEPQVIYLGDLEE